MSCQSKPRAARTKERVARGPGRGIAVLIASCLVGGGAAAWAAGNTETVPDRTGVWAMPGGEVPGQAGTLMGQTDRAFASKRSGFVKKMTRRIAQVDEQVEMIDEMIITRKDARMGERYDDDIERKLLALQNARAELRYKRSDAQDALERVRAAGEDRWPELREQAQDALVALDAAYEATMGKLYH